MSFILTLVASDPNIPLSFDHFTLDRFEGVPQWLSPHKAGEIRIDEKPDVTLWREKLKDHRIDVFISPEEGRRKRLLMADMDSTIVAEETLDELAGHAGIKEQVALITARAMAGDLDFHEALKERVGLLKDLSAEMLNETLRSTTINPGAKTLVQTMKKHGAECVLVSGGFTFFTGAIAENIGFDYHHGNMLELADGKLTGNVIDPILDKDSKLSYLKSYTHLMSLQESASLAIGDGANDLPMLEAAGIGIGFHAKPLVVEALDNQIIHGDLTAALYAQGYNDEEIVQAG